ncbi:alginate biosynthesis sensor protein KinB [archaeon BMS3Abin16]|nr:alginate biosynthesis sensor protein KinB [archaeon BMS3Abin16]
MVVRYILAVSVLLQFTAAFLALKLIRVTGRRAAWILIAAAILLMAVRRSITLYRLASGHVLLQPDPTAELVALVISVLMVAGIAKISSLFLSIKQSEEALRESEEKFRGLAEKSPNMIFINMKGRIVYANEACQEILGYRREEFYSPDFNFLSLIAPECADLVKANFERHAKGREVPPVEYTLITKEGKRIVGLHTTKLIRYEGESAVLGIIADITERKRAEEELRRVNRGLKMLSAFNQTLVRTMDEPSLLRNTCRVIVEVGGYRFAWIGFAESDEEKTVRPVAQAGYEKGYLDTVHIVWSDTEQGRGPTGTAIRTGKSIVCKKMLTDPRYSPWRSEASERGYASSIALPLIARDQTLGALNVYAREPDAFDSEEVKLLVELADDLAYGIMALRTRAEHERSEKALKTAWQELKSLDELKSNIITNVGHELRTPLTIANSALELASDEEDPKEKNMLLKMAENALSRQNIVVENLIEAASMKPHKMKLPPAPVNMDQIITLVCDEFIRTLKKHDLTIELRVEKELPLVKADNTKLKLILRNLLENAIKFNKKGGKIVLNARKKDGVVEVCVRDTGIGIPKDG